MSITIDIAVLCWIAFVVYWAINWKNSKPSKLRPDRKVPLRIIGIAIVTIFLLYRFLLGKSMRIGPHIMWFLSRPTILPLAVFGDLLTVAGVTVAIIARHTLADNWSSKPDIKKGHELVTTGVYSVVRHPIYTGMLMMSIGAVCDLQSMVSLIILAIALVVILTRIPKEERFMTQTFPDQYPAYKKHTNALIPFVW